MQVCAQGCGVCPSTTSEHDDGPSSQSGRGTQSRHSALHVDAKRYRLRAAAPRLHMGLSIPRRVPAERVAERVVSGTSALSVVVNLRRNKNKPTAQGKAAQRILQAQAQVESAHSHCACRCVQTLHACGAVERGTCASIRVAQEWYPDPKSNRVPPSTPSSPTHVRPPLRAASPTPNCHLPAASLAPAANLCALLSSTRSSSDESALTPQSRVIRRAAIRLRAIRASHSSPAPA
ncbi:hypothetical protein FB567DRAFT_555864 [Paraphoma chrysanthemicola]|uniref:Uncharacterized protein n=1 Tax=Paraphoma chrysanthemicola TaxID=798071 RepID=A0A8K0VR68_9PLEO|nr:hypothetical protein FB567DRAFT_555864 [Paraphoma chrysanthemicola]